MKIIGLIAEYNPFHYGHIYHINKIKEKYPDSILILVVNGYFSQRGDASIISKENKTKITLNNGIDLVLELPILYGSQSADIFANYAVKILNYFKVDEIIFGSESNNVIQLELIAKKQLDNSLDIKKYLDEGLNYPTALAKALNTTFTYNPNDLLGITYIKAILQNKFNIKYSTIQRTNSYHDLTSNEKIISASNIRKKLKNKEDISKYIPQEEINYLEKIDEKLLFNLLKYKINTCTNLDDYLDVDEGLENKLKKEINNVRSSEELVMQVKSKRYTYNKIKRMLLHILLEIKKDYPKQISYINILGFNENGQKYLKEIKEDIDSITKKDYTSLEYITEINAMNLYSLITNKGITFDKQNKPIKQ